METQNREVIKLRKKANFKILTRLGQIIEPVSLPKVSADSCYLQD